MLELVLGELVGPAPPPTSLSRGALLDRIAAEERLVDALLASQSLDLAEWLRGTLKSCPPS